MDEVKLQKEEEETQKIEEETQTPIEEYLQEEVSAGEVDSLQQAVTCSPFFALFKELARTHLHDFFMKMAVLLQLAQDKEKNTWTPQEIVQEFHWLQETPRKRIIQQLSRSGWLEYVENKYQISGLGKTILPLLQALPKKEVADALGANVSSLSLLESYENDPTNSLRMFLNELVRVDDHIVSTLTSKSEYLVQKLNNQVRSQFDVAIKSREYMENLPAKDFQSYRLKQQIHEKLSGFHARVSHVQRAQSDLVARKIILADRSLSQHDVNTFMINSSLDQLAEIGRGSIYHPININDFVPSLMVYETEWFLERNLEKEAKRGWSDEAEKLEESSEGLKTDGRFTNLVAEVNQTLKRHTKFAIEHFVPSENWGNSGFRFSMLAALEGGELPDNVALENKMNYPNIAIEYPETEGVALPSVELENRFSGVKEITQGVVRKKEEKQTNEPTGQEG